MAKPTNVTLTIREGSGDLETTTMSFFIASSVSTIATITAEAKALAEAIQAVITGDVIAAQYSKPFDITGWTLVPSDGADTDRLVSARLLLASAESYYARWNFPTFDLAKLGTGKDVDLTDVDVIALLAAVDAQTPSTSQDYEVMDNAGFYRTYGGKK